MHVYLKMKIKSLTAEAQIIRREERKLKASAWYQRWKAEAGLARGQLAGLQEHRRFDVRREARAAHLAYGFLRGRAYRTMEAKAYLPPDWKRVEKLALKYGEGATEKEIAKRFAEWKDGAEVGNPQRRPAVSPGRTIPAQQE